MNKTEEQADFVGHSSEELAIKNEQRAAEIQQEAGHKAMERSQPEIDITCWIFDNIQVTSSAAEKISKAIVDGQVPHVSVDA